MEIRVIGLTVYSGGEGQLIHCHTVQRSEREGDLQLMQVRRVFTESPVNTNMPLPSQCTELQIPVGQHSRLNWAIEQMIS